MSENTQSQSSSGWGFGNFFESMKKVSSEVTKMASDLVDKSANEAIRIYGEIKSKGEEMMNEINAKENELKESPVTVLPWLLPEFKELPEYQRMLKEDILLLSKDLDTFLKSVEGCEDEQYNPSKNSQLIVLLREQDMRLQKARFLLVQKEKKVDDDHFWRNYIFRVFQIIKNYEQTIAEEKSGKVVHAVNDNNEVNDNNTVNDMNTVNDNNDNSTVNAVSETNNNNTTPSTDSSNLLLETKPMEQSMNSSPVPMEQPKEEQPPTVPTPIEAPISTIPEVVHTVEDIYDFDNMSDIEKEMGDVDLDEVDSGDLSDIEAEILAEL